MLDAAQTTWLVNWEPFPADALFNDSVAALMGEKYSRLQYNQKR
jgi:hypothetical protein